MAIFGLFCWQGARSPRPRTVQYHQIYVFNGSKPKMAIKILFVDIQPVDTQAFRPVNNCDVIFKQHIPETIDLKIIAKQQKKQETNNLARVAVITSKGKRMIQIPTDKDPFRRYPRPTVMLFSIILVSSF